MNLDFRNVFAFGPGWLRPRPADRRRLVLFDGVCGLCDAAVRFLIGKDHGQILRYAPLQGTTAASEPAVARLLEAEGARLDSVFYLRGEGDGQELLTRSAAVLAILDDLGGLWRLVALARFVPRPIRDAVYDFIARNRYRWFGKLEACRLPRAGEAELFLD